MCGATLALGWAPPVTVPHPSRAGRAARFAWRLLVVAGASASASACGARTGLVDPDAAGIADAAPARDAGTDSGVARDAGRDAGFDAGDFDAGDIAIYGAPPPDRPSPPMPVVPAPEPARVVRGRRRRSR